MEIPKVGMRTIKTGIGICALAGGYLVENPMYAGVACLVSIQDTVKGSVKLGLNRMKGTILGGIIGFICILISPGNALLCGLGSMATIYGCTALNIKSGIIVSSVTFLSIHLGVITSTPLEYSIYRVLDTSIGVIIGIIINYTLARPDYFESTQNQSDNVKKVINEYLKNKVIVKKKFSLSIINKEIRGLESLYSKLVDEQDYTKESHDIEIFKSNIVLFNKIYQHIQAIELLKKKLYITKSNKAKLENMYNINNLDWNVDDKKSPVFNYHLSKIIEELENIK